MSVHYGCNVPDGMDIWHVPGLMRWELLKYLGEHASGKRVIVEIGTYKGLSAAVLAGCSQGVVYCVDNWLDDYGEKNENPTEIYTQFLAHMAHFGFLDGKVVPIACTSDVAWKMFVDIPIDMLFIDGLHSYAGVTADLSLWYGLVREGGLICGDDWLSPSVAHAVKDFASRHRISYTAILDGVAWTLER